MDNAVLGRRDIPGDIVERLLSESDDHDVFHASMDVQPVHIDLRCRAPQGIQRVFHIIL